MTWWGLQWGVHCWSPLCYISLPYLLIQHASEQWWSSQRPRRAGKDTALTMVRHEPALISICRPQVCCTPYSITESHSLSHLTHSCTIATTEAFTLQRLRSRSRSTSAAPPSDICPTTSAPQHIPLVISTPTGFFQFYALLDKTCAGDAIMQYLHCPTSHTPRVRVQHSLPETQLLFQNPTLHWLKAYIRDMTPVFE